MRRYALIGLVVVASAVPAQDMPLSQVLIPGEAWKAVAVKGEATCLAADADGNALVASEEGTIWRLAKAGPEVFAKDAKVRAMAWNPKGHLVTVEGYTLYRRDSGAERVEIAQVGTVPDQFGHLVDNLAVSPTGEIYYTISMPKGKHRSRGWVSGADILRVGHADRLAASPAVGGLVFWRDGGALVVGDAAGDRLVAYRVGKDKLDAPEGYYTLRAKEGKSSGVKALTLDADGRLYAATALGVQVFDPTGRMCGVINPPARKPVTALAFAGPGRDHLYVVCDGKLYARKTKVKGFVPASKKP